MYRGARQAEIALEARDVPETAAALHQIGEAAIDQHVNGDAFITVGNGVVVHLAYRDFTVVHQRTAVERAEVVGVQVNHQFTGVQAVFGLGIERGKVALRLAAARHHADVVAADQRIQAGNAGERSFRRNQPELGTVAQRVFQIALDAGFDHNAAQILTQADGLHGADIHPLITHGSAARDDTRRRLEIDGNRGAALLEVAINQPPRDQQGDKRQ
ncbi:hypothetical protein D3C79_819010 [compost metagenome]